MTELPLRAWADIDLDALVSNLEVFRGRLTPPTTVLGVVKADAYGHGAQMVARALQAAGVRLFGVATIAEAVELREAGIDDPIWHLGLSLPEEAAALLEWRVTPTACDLDLARALAERHPDGPPVPVHLKLDSGMGRRGLGPSEARSCWRWILESGRLTVEGLCTHFATADVDPAFAAEQLERFVAWRDELAADGYRAPLTHAANSAAALRFPAAHFDVIRPGIAIYGIAAFDAPGVDRLRPVMAVYTRLCQVRELPAGHEVGYAHGCRLDHPTRVGIVSMGYGDGWPWRLSGVGEALVEGRRVPYLGRVNMDLIQLDLNSVPGARVGEDVVLLGRDGEEAVDAVRLAGLAGVSEYTIPTQLSRRVIRRYYRDGRLAHTGGAGEIEEKGA